MSITLVQKNKSKGIMTWYARVPDPHKKSSIHFFSLGTTSKSEAKLIMQQRLKEGAYDIKDEAETMTLGEAAVDCIKWVIMRISDDVRKFGHQYAKDLEYGANKQRIMFGIKGKITYTFLGPAHDPKA